MNNCYDIIMNREGGEFLKYYIDFYINNKTHEIHQFGCDYIPTENIIYLGIYSNLDTALVSARSKGFTSAFTCNYCNIIF